MTEERKKRLRKKLISAREALHRDYGEFALPLWDKLYFATSEVSRVSTNGTCILFEPNWLQKLTDEALQFILAHELMHISLGHIDRPAYYRGDRFHLVCDIVANSHLKEMGWEQTKIPGVRNIYTQTFFPKFEGCDLTAQEAMKGVPFDPASLKPGERRRYMIDSEEWWDRKLDRDIQGVLLLYPEPEVFGNGAGKHTAKPSGIRSEEKETKSLMPIKVDVKVEKTAGETPKILHNTWNIESMEALQNLMYEKERQEAAGVQEEFRERIWARTTRATLNWRELLHRFVQTEICDYSFLPPDRRMADTEFFLPDFNAPIEKPVKVWFMVDTSASISDEVLDVVYGELCSALIQMGNQLEGWLGFFDVQVYQPLPFSDLTDLANIKPRGGGGTNFSCIFEYLERRNEKPDSLVIFTDGDGKFPQEVKELPVLWLFTDSDATAPWGSAAFVSSLDQGHGGMN